MGKGMKTRRFDETTPTDIAHSSRRHRRGDFGDVSDDIDIFLFFTGTQTVCKIIIYNQYFV
jgi:hypothetical protein